MIVIWECQTIQSFSSTLNLHELLKNRQITNLMKKKNRIDILDSFRFLAILFVMLYHYYSRWIPPINNTSLYPYGNSYNYFQYGYMGVEFFFILSGFFVFHSLSESKNIISFWKNKLIRLFPPLLICSLITFLVFRLFDSELLMRETHSLKNLLVSLTFISPNVIDHLFGTHTEYINGSYWFLWTEIQFYFIASIVYFVNRKQFIRNYTIFSFILCVFHYTLFRINANTYSTDRLNLHFSELMKFNFLFMIGIFLFMLYENRHRVLTQIMVGAIVLAEILMEFHFWNNTEKWIIMLILVLLLLFIYSPKYLQWITIKPFTSIGLSSYSLYLIHEYIGVLLINKYANTLGRFDFLLPVVLIILFMILCYLGYKYIEKPLSTKLKYLLLNKSQSDKKTLANNTN